ncbi:MAG: RIP metalloprotease RseP [Clostridiales bacterium]|nr:RIP metalloprotease RseP [Clostridiales bacterium]
MKIVVALLIFGLIVMIHELGHFLLAKKNGITVTEFSIGMGPRLFSFMKGGTRYSLKLFPIGGSCAMGEDDPENTDEGNFNNKNVWARISTIFAGPFFNFVLAFLLSLIVVGIVGYDPAEIMVVPEGSNAESSGLQVGDVITEIDGKNVVFSRDVYLYTEMMGVSKKPFTIKVKRNGKEETIEYTPAYTKKYMLGFYYDPKTSVVSSVTRGGAMEEAGVVANDTITKINGVEVNAAYTLSDYLEDHPLDGDVENVIEYKHNGNIKTAKLTPRMTEIYDLDFGYNIGYTKTGFWSTIRYSFSNVRYWIEATVRSLGQLVTGKLSTRDLGGPVRIVDELGSVVDQKQEIGLKNVILQLLEWAILLSANLGVMNLIPLPALDGGRLFFLFVEAVRGKPISREKEGYVHGIGFILLMVLMVFIFFNDIKNIFF